MVIRSSNFTWLSLLYWSSYQYFLLWRKKNMKSSVKAYVRHFNQYEILNDANTFDFSIVWRLFYFFLFRYYSSSRVRMIFTECFTLVRFYAIFTLHWSIWRSSLRVDSMFRSFNDNAVSMQSQCISKFQLHPNTWLDSLNKTNLRALRYHLAIISSPSTQRYLLFLIPEIHQRFNVFWFHAHYWRRLCWSYDSIVTVCNFSRLTSFTRMSTLCVPEQSENLTNKS